ncbi:hypothetical protein D9M72_549100 [compost metagenome]
MSYSALTMECALQLVIHNKVTLPLLAHTKSRLVEANIYIAYGIGVTARGRKCPSRLEKGKAFQKTLSTGCVNAANKLNQFLPESLLCRNF